MFTLPSKARKDVVNQCLEFGPRFAAQVAVSTARFFRSSLTDVTAAAGTVEVRVRYDSAKARGSNLNK